MTTSSKTNMNEDLRKEFDKRYKELHNSDYKSEEPVEFGYRYLKGDEIITVTDWGNVYKFLETAITKAREEGLLEGRKLITKDMVEAMKIK